MTAKKLARSAQKWGSRDPRQSNPLGRNAVKTLPWNSFRSANFHTPPSQTVISAHSFTHSDRLLNSQALADFVAAGATRRRILITFN